MPRHKRLDVSGAVYHVISRGIERRAIYNDDEDRTEFLKRLAAALSETKSVCYGWVLMPNHFHLIIRSGIKPLSTVMRKILTGYAVYFNRRHKRNGYLYQNRYKSILCQEETYLLELVRYVHLNPLRGKLVRTLEELKAYKWSGHTVLMGDKEVEWQARGEILSRFGRSQKQSIVNYEAYIRDGLHMGRREDLTGGGLRRSAGGWAGVMELKKSKEQWRSDERILGDGAFVTGVLKVSEEMLNNKERLKRNGWNIDRIAETVSKKFSIKKAELFKKGRESNASRARMIVAYLATQKLGASHTSVAEYLRVSKSAIIRAARKGELLDGKYNIEATIK